MKKQLHTNGVRVSCASGNALRSQLLLFFLLSTSVNLLAQRQLAADINQTHTRDFGEYHDLTDAGGVMYYVDDSFYYDSDGSAHLWRTDGTKAGTFMLTSNNAIHSLTSAGDKLFFVVLDSYYGEELFVSDGTKDGTRMVKDIAPGYGVNSSPQELTSLNGVLYFTANDGQTGRELWRSDGTSQGTYRVKDIISSGGSSNPTGLAGVNGVLYFSANDARVGYELWRSDGTDAGTYLVKDLRTGERLSSTPQNLTDVNGTLYFTALDTETGRELWKSDGTADGTVMIKDIREGTLSSTPENLTGVGSVLYFSAYTAAAGRELWKSDGTENGTLLVKDLTPGAGSAAADGFPHLSQFVDFNGELYFLGFTNRLRVWKSDGTTSGTIPISPENTNFTEIDPNLTTFNGALYYVSNANEGQEMLLWKTDGTPENHQIIKRAGIWHNPDMELTPSGSKMFFTTLINTQGKEQLFYTDGTTQGTRSVDFSHYTYGSYPSNITKMNGYLYFTATNGAQNGLFRSKGVTYGTTLIKALGGSANLYNANNTSLYFTNTSNGEHTLWKSDGTEAGTVRLAPIAAGLFPSFKYQSIGNLVFIAASHNNQTDLWRSDGTTSGTVKLHTFPSRGSITWMEKSGSTLLFGANDSVTGYELWKSDGTVAGTSLLREFYPGPSHGVSDGVTYNGRVYFLADNGVDEGYELWRSDGTASGTQIVKDGPDALIGPMGVAGGRIYFFSSSLNIYGYHSVSAVWKSTGTSSGTVKVKDVDFFEPGQGYEYIIPMSGGQQFYFIAAIGMGDHDLWTTDGTSEGTKLLYEFGFREGFAEIDYAFAGSKLYFSESREGFIMRTDGTQCGSFYVPLDKEPASGALIENLNVEVFNNTLYYPNWGDDTGVELYKYIDNATCEDATLASARTSSAEEVYDDVSSDEVTITSYPNPFTQEFDLTISGKEAGNYKIEVQGMDGNILEQMNEVNYNETYRLGSRWAPGIYVLKIQGENGVITRRIIKTR